MFFVLFLQCPSTAMYLLTAYSYALKGASSLSVQYSRFGLRRTDTTAAVVRTVGTGVLTLMPTATEFTSQIYFCHSVVQERLSG